MKLNSLTVFEQLGTIIALPFVQSVCLTHLFIHTREKKSCSVPPRPLLVGVMPRSAVEAAVKAPCIIKDS